MNKVVLIIISLLFIGNIHAQNIEKGLYISYNGGIIPKYAILTVEEDSASLEVFTKWQGAWLPAIGSWDNSYEPQKLIRSADGSLSNENVVITCKNEIKGIVKNSVANRIRFKFKNVEELPSEFEEVRQKGLDFTRR